MSESSMIDAYNDPFLTGEPIEQTAPYGVYVQADDMGRITAINSDAFLPSLEGWVKIDEGYGDQYHHAQGNYLPGPLMDERGLYSYKLANGKAIPRTQEEMDADYVEPEPVPTIESRVETVESKTTALEDELLAAKILLGLEA